MWYETQHSFNCSVVIVQAGFAIAAVALAIVIVAFAIASLAYTSQTLLYQLIERNKNCTVNIIGIF